MKPTARNVRTLPNGVHTLEKGVYLRVSNERRTWIFKYQKDGRRHELGLGGIDQSISTVLGKAAKLRALLSEGVDPAEEKKRRREASKQRIARFGDYVPEFLENLQFTRMFTNPNTIHYWDLRMRFWCAEFSSLMLHEVTPEAIANVLKPTWTDNPRAGKDNLSAVRTYFTYLVGRGIVAKNPAEWDGGVGRYLPKVSAVLRSKPVKHHAAMSAEELRDFVQSIRNDTNVSAKAVLLIALTATRCQELRELKWSEVDEVRQTATVPTERRKDKKPEPFLVPLSRQAMELIEGIGSTGGEYVFEGDIKGESVSHSGVYAYIKSRTSYGLHGIRSTFSDWCAKNGKNLVVSEKCLMHSVGGKVFMAYQRNDLLEQRRVLLQEWADFLLGVE